MDTQDTNEKLIAADISFKLAQDPDFIALSAEEKIEIIRRLNGIVNHELYVIE